MNFNDTVDRIIESYRETGGINRNGAENFPNRENVVSVLSNLQALIFPGFKYNEQLNDSNLREITEKHVEFIFTVLTQEIQKALVYITTGTDTHENVKNSHCFNLAEKVVTALLEEIPVIRKAIILDAKAILNGDPAAKSLEEVILSYPGLTAITVYRIAHFLHTNGVPVIPRIMSEHVHGKTGIDIHPGATIGESFFIDHGTGIVIGESTIIGRNVKIYQGVTLGALAVEKEMMHKKRHPTIEDDVTIYSGATILGGETVIGKGCIIGGNTWVTRSVPEGTTVTQRG